MNVLGCENRCSCVLGAALLSLIVGVVTAFLQVTAVITVAPVLYWVTFGIAVGFVAISLVTTSLASCTTVCGRGALIALLIGAVATAILSLVLLAVQFVATSILGAILLGVLLFFFTWMLTNAACYAINRVTICE